MLGALLQDALSLGGLFSAAASGADPIAATMGLREQACQRKDHLGIQPCQLSSTWEQLVPRALAEPGN